MTETNKEDFLDLDALTPKSKKVMFQGNVVEIKPPRTGQLMVLMGLGQEIKNISPDDETAYDTCMTKIGDKIKEIAPELKDAVLELGQINALILLIIDMALPNQIDELKKRGITVDLPKAQPE